ncbi:MAG: ATP-dependent helicase [Lachnospiraceae bacterium]
MLTGTTKAQARAIIHRDGPALVLAGPGSGKTFVITKRLQYLITEHNIPSTSILVITFTKAAALEMEERFHKILPKEQPWFGTFHACFYHILKQSFANLPTRFISNDEKKRLISSLSKDILNNEHMLDSDEIVSLLSLYMNLGLSTKDLPQYDDIKPSHIQQLYCAYHRALIENDYLDFDNLMLMCFQLLKDNDMIRNKFRNQFRYLLIDECQDMNIVQYQIVKLLSGPDKNVFMVGDDDQSVYRFRGAKVALMQQFIKEYDPVTQIELDKNFRSTAGIVDRSLDVIGVNKNRFFKKVEAHNESTDGLLVKEFDTRTQMFEEVFRYCQTLSEESLDEIAIIYRTNQELQRMAYKLRQNKIPYITKEDQKSIFDEDWYLDIEAYFELGLGSKERRHILRVANKPNRFIKREQIMQIQVVPELLAQGVKHINTMRPYLALKYIWHGIGYGRWLERRYESQPDQLDAVVEQMKELEEDMKRFDTLIEWLDHVKLDRYEQKEKIIESKKTQQTHGVRLLTMHASKGLEYDRVYLLDVNQGKLPKGSKLTLEELEEERRLFYVAMTRAKKELCIYYLKGVPGHMVKPSIFIEPLL